MWAFEIMGTAPKSKASNFFAGQEARLRQVAQHSTPVAVSKLMLSEGEEEAAGRPALFVGAFGKTLSEFSDRRQAQFGKQDGEAGGVDLIILHARTSSVMVGTVMVGAAPAGMRLS